MLGNGSDEMLDLCARLFLSPGDTLVNFPPSFGVYSFLGHLYDANIVHVERAKTSRSTSSERSANWPARS